jgi:hypothetical protein
VAVAFDAVGPSSAGVSSSASTTLSWTHTNVAAGVALLVAVAVDKSPDTGLSVTVALDPSGANTPFTSLGAIVHTNAATSGFVALFGLANVSSGAHTITATVSGGTPSTMEGGSLSYTGAGSTVGAAFSALQSATGSSASPAGSFTGSTAGNIVAAAVAGGFFINNITTGTSRWIKNAGGSAGAGNEAGGDSAGGGTVSFAWSVAATDFWAVATVEIKATAAVVLPILTMAPMTGA